MVTVFQLRDFILLCVSYHCKVSILGFWSVACTKKKAKPWAVGTYGEHFIFILFYFIFYYFLTFYGIKKMSLLYTINQQVNIIIIMDSCFLQFYTKSQSPNELHNQKVWALQSSLTPHSNRNRIY